MIADVFGTIGTVLWCIQLIPQIFLNYRRKTTDGLSSYLNIGWILSSIFLGPYVITQWINIPIIVQPQCYGSLCAICFIQMLYYDRKWTPWQGIGAFGVYAVIGGGFQTAGYFACRAAERKGIHGVTIFYGSMSDFFLTAAFLPQFYDVYKAKEVVGVSYLFLGMDSLGAVFSILSLAFEKNEEIDVVALIGYIGVLVVECTLMLMALYYNPRAEKRRKLLGLETAPEKTEAGPSDLEGTFNQSCS